MQDLKYDSSTRVLLWRLEEDGPQLLDLCRQRGIPVDDLLEVPRKRLREKAVERLLLQQAFGRQVSLVHTPQGAPAVQEFPAASVSITHTMQLVALACGTGRVVGIDAESSGRHQVLKVRDKYLNASEKQFIGDSDLEAHIIVWTAKEAVIKAERNSSIDWTEGICLEPFAVGSDKTVLTAHYQDRRYRLTCRLIEGHYITVAHAAAD